MDGVGQWRLVEADDGDQEERPEKSPPAEPGQRTTFLLITTTAALVVLAVGLAIWATLPAGGAGVEQQDEDVAGAAFVPAIDGLGDGNFVAAGPTAAAAGAALFVVVDVQGAVSAPGVHELPAGSRVADAIEAAGGYAPTVDISAASRQLNLAEKIVDGAQIHVPALGETAASATGAATPATSSTGATGGLIDLNSATAEQLDTLPGIGPVTATKILDARSEAPFTSVDDLLARGVVGASTFEKVRDLVTVTP